MHQCSSGVTLAPFGKTGWEKEAGGGREEEKGGREGRRQREKSEEDGEGGGMEELKFIILSKIINNTSIDKEY